MSLFVVLFAGALILSAVTLQFNKALATTSCDNPANGIVAENCLAGNPPSEWDISGDGDQTIQGFATDISVDKGQAVSFKVATNASAYRFDIYRMGYYGGMGARKVATILPSAALPQSQPGCLNEVATGLIDCGNWDVSGSWSVPVTATSGIYFAKVVRNDTGGASHIVFVVRDDSSHSDMLFQTSDTTWQAYNQYGGNSLYTGSPAGRAYKVSYNRPFTTRRTSDEDWLFNSEYPMVRFLEANGYDVSYFTGVDTDRLGSLLLNHKTYLSVGHDEYWSGGQRANVETARNAGVNLAFFSGNEMFWKTRWEDSTDGSNTPYRTLVSYKETHANSVIDPADPPTWTGTWRDPRFSPPADGGRPENALTGQLFMVNCCSYAMTVPAADGKMRFWRNTAIANLPANGSFTLPDGTLGYEWDEDFDNGARPAGMVRLSSSTINGVQYLQDYGSTYSSGTANHHMTLYKHSSGALVFGAGTVQWPWGLDSNHDRGNNAPDASMQQATVNLFADMGVQPASLMSGLAATGASTDTSAPTSTITSPTAGAHLQSGVTVTVSGTALDTGGVVGDVEVSVDGGDTWHPANGRANWTYSWVPGAAGSATIKSRAVDDSGNIETPSAGVTVSIDTRACPCSIWSNSNTPSNPSGNDNQPIEVGVKFKSGVDGYITGLRFYKGTANTGTHTGHLWTATGTQLASATFTSESASGWQEIALGSPVQISADTTYVASYLSAGGGYAVSNPYFTQAYDSAPLHALANGTDGPNGVYKYGGGFPTDNFQTSNYWVDVVFATSVGPDTTPPSVLAVSPTNGSADVGTGANVTVSFSEAIDQPTINVNTIELRDSANNLVPSAITYNAGSHVAMLDPDNALANSSTYTALVKGGSTDPRVKDLAGNALQNNYTWSFTTAAPPPPPPDDGPGGPVLVISDSSNPFSRYYAEILRAEGLNAFTVSDLSNISAAVLANYDVAILGEMSLTADQANMFSSWVNGGGNLIAMRPAPQLASLLGLTSASGSLSNRYLLVNSSAAPGAGIVNQTIQFHGSSDLYNLTSGSGATAVATLYSDANTATSNPAVTMRSVGTNGGQAAAFAYDLARSVIYTRQGNPAWSGDERDGQSGPIRSDDLYYGAKAGDVQADWVDLNKVAIPQADEQQRLLANMIGYMNIDKKPLPRFWYFPKGLKSVVILTADGHPGGAAVARFNSNIAASTAGCSVDDWECIRSTEYLYVGAPMSDAQAANFNAQGFEIGLHVNTDCDNWTPSSLEGFYANQLLGFASAYPSLPAIKTNRTHCIAWSDYDTQPQVELNHGIRLDTNYYYWPGSWIQDRPGMFTGSGMIMRFAQQDGTMIDSYQAATQMTDESGQSYPLHINSLLDKALGAESYYGAFTANIHVDGSSEGIASTIISSAQARGVPVITARQMLTWVDGRNSSSFDSMTWNANTLNFSIAVGSGARNLQAMVPTSSAVGALTGITRNGSPLSYTTQTIKGVSYAFFPANAGSYQAVYAVDTTPPAISAVSVVPGSGGTATVGWTTDEASNSRVDYGTSAGSLNLNAADSALVTNHSIVLSGLNVNTTYYYRVTSADAASNTSTYPAPNDPAASFTTPAASLGDTTAADFGAGTTGAGTYVSEIEDGEVLLAPTVGTEFSGTSLPSGWDLNAWDIGGAASVSGGAVLVDGARLGTSATFGSGRSMEFVATFGNAGFQHAGFGVDYNSAPWAMFSSKDGSGLFARTNDGSAIDTPIPGSLLGSPHRYRIDWTATGVTYYVDGAQVASHPVAISTAMRPLISDLTVGGAHVSVDWLHMSPYSASGTFMSRVLSTGTPTNWGSLSWSANLPSDASLTMSVRTGNTPNPDGSWSQFTTIPASGGTIGGNSSYIQYRADLSSTDPANSTALEQVMIGYNNAGVTTTPTITGTPVPTASPTSAPTSTVAPLSFRDTTSVDFGAGVADAGAYVGETGDGEVMLAPTEGTEFSGTSLPSSWTVVNTWSSGGSAAVSGGNLSVDGALAATGTYYAPGRSLEFVATFGSQTFQHVGFGVDVNNSPNWAMFSTNNQSNPVALWARSNNGSAQNTLIPGDWLGAPHLFRIDWSPSSVTYYIDGTVVATHTITISAQMRPLVSDFTTGTPVIADWVRMSPYATTGSFISRVFDAGSPATWEDITWLAQLPAGTSLTMSVRTGDTAVPDNSWTDFTVVPTSGGTIGAISRYIQYRAELSTSDLSNTPALQQVTITYSNGPVPTVTNTSTAVSATSTYTPTSTALPPTATDTPVPPTATSTDTPVPPTATSTDTPVPPTATHTNTPVPPTTTDTPVPPTATPTDTPVPPTATSTDTPVPPTATATDTPVPPTATPTDTPVPPTATPTDTPVPPT
ncbi:MAG: N,N-dimethylformamidase beta subunit family domain-containing protein, partial [Chloroflexota bacterium]